MSIETILISPNPLLIEGMVPSRPYCTGGTVTTIGTVRIHTFTSSDTLVVVRPGRLDYLVVAGGGGGGYRVAGGGGGGGMLTGTLAVATAGNIAVVVGNGGNGAAADGAGADGGLSSLGAIVATGGGGGGGYNTNGRNGGSGGGSKGYSPGGAGTGIAGQGNNGGAYGGDYAGGGGGGAGAVGGAGDGVTDHGGNGGDGAVSAISGVATTYAGGGGGASYVYDYTSTGGAGGGGNGGDRDTAATSGGANTGGGGGGSERSGAAGNGGSGIVIVSYDTAVSSLIEGELMSEYYHEELSSVEFQDAQYEVRDIGGFWSCQFKVANPKKEWAIEFVNNGCGRMVRFYSEKSNLVWEGFVSTVEMRIGASNIKASLVDMANKVWVRYSPLAGGAVTRSNVMTNAKSQNKWGIKEEVLNGGQITSVEADQRANAYLDRMYWSKPVLESIQLGRTEDITLTIYGLGYWHTLGWRTYNQTANTGTDNAAAIVLAVVAACGEFVKSTEYEGNGTSVTKVYDADRRADDIIESICELGDPEYNVFVAGMEADRHFYYRKAAPSEREAIT